MSGRGGLGFRLLIGIYRLLFELAVWLLLVPWQLAARPWGLLPADSLAQRLGRGRLPPLEGGPRILVHAVSAGETAAAGPIIAELLQLLPQAQVLVTSGNGAGLATAGALATRLPRVRAAGLLPWDRQRALDPWLDRLAPDLVVVMETELWPNLFRLCQERGIPLALANGRIYPRDLAGYRLLGPLFQPLLAGLDWAGAQDPVEAGRLAAIGVPAERIAVVGNSKLDAAWELPPAVELGPGPLIVAGSTHPPEERWLLDALVRLRRDGPPPRLVLAPRRIGRAASLCAAARRRGLRASRWSELPAWPDWEVLVLDRIGPLAACFGAADLVFVGGSLAPRGGHNLLEPAAWGKPILVGPHTQHFQQLAQGLEAAGGLVRVPDAGQLASLFAALLRDPVRCRARGDAARRWLRTQGGGAVRQALALSKLLNLRLVD